MLGARALQILTPEVISHVARLLHLVAEEAASGPSQGEGGDTPGDSDAPPPPAPAPAPAPVPAPQALPARRE